MVKRSGIIAVLRILRKEKSTTMLGTLAEEEWTPFQILISTILSARARDEVTEVIAERLFRRYPTAHELARANPKEVQEIIRPIGFYRQKAKSVIATAKGICGKFNDKVPQTLEELMTLRGVGRKVANCVLVYAFKKPAIPVDTHVHKLANHFGWVKTKTPEQTEFALMRLIPQQHWQAVNDTLVSHGKSINYRRLPHKGTVLEKYCKTCRKVK
jgi:endonuclease-3